MEQTRQIRGGVSTLRGVRFEIMAVLYELPYLLEGQLSSVRYQPLSSATSPGQPFDNVYVDDYSAEEENGHQGHLPLAGAVKGIYDTLKALRDGKAPTELQGNVASAELMGQLTRREDYDRWTSEYLN